ncbi:acylglycerol lipase [Malassezia vespertilionis]|uniref:acylglycerol lipase n=1 Tax=Malassezia vespertilionis TaxID=2020962 RepID=UPI0024B06E17|nr:acylglycerol lipase [Malassezia vespertilionis]WFD07968.1 acylglycerol lipase [Malassezia vespertilionis]
MQAYLTELYYIFLEPVLLYLGLTTQGSGDPTYGRDRLPYSAQERSLIYENPNVRSTRRRVYLCGTDPVLDVELQGVHALPSTYKNKRLTSFVNYYIWEMPSVAQLNADVYLVHGINDYSGKLTVQGTAFMRAGMRAIAIDLPSFGRSSGLPAYVPSMRVLANALHAVMAHVHFHDTLAELPALARRKRFGQGSSMGGFTVLYHCALYPPAAPAKLGGLANGARLSLDGVAVSAPMLQIASASRPSYTLEWIARRICMFAGRLPFAKAIRGNVSDDPKVDYYASIDPQNYRGLVRIATGLAIVAGIDDLARITSRIQCPVSIDHGENDRATSPHGSIAFFEKLHAEPKRLRLWPGVEHASC